MMLRERQQTLRQRAAASGFDYVVLAPGANLYYFTGLSIGLSERPIMAIIPVSGPVTLLVPELEATRAGLFASVDSVVCYRDEDGPLEALRQACEGLPADGIAGFEYRSFRLQELELLRTAIGDFAYRDAGPLFSSQRMTKQPQELELMARAAAFAEIGMESALRAIAEGVSEYQVQRMIEDDLRRAGVTGTIVMSVASGERSGAAHSRTSTRLIRDGDLVLVDLMVSHEHYYADITRTFTVGQVSAELAQIYQVVLEAQQATRETAKPGMTGRQIDQVARDIIESRGFGKYFTHRTGHGIGLEIHEEPYIVGSNDVPLEAGMTFTIEPGIYLPGKGGVRIEDDVVLVSGGCRSLTSFRRNLLTQKSKYVV